MLGLDQVQQMHLKQKELRIEENSPPVSYYPLKLGKSVVKFKLLVYIRIFQVFQPYVGIFYNILN